MESEATTELGLYIRRQRQRERMTIRQLADAAGVDFSWLGRLERGEYASPDARLLGAVARGLGLDPSDLNILAGYPSGDGLPEFAPYLRAKYDLPADVVSQLEANFDYINRSYRRTRGGGDHH